MRINAGDCLSSIAQKVGVSLQSLERANPQVKNPNLIFAGANLNVPGARDEFVGGSSTAGGAPTTGGAAAASSGPMPSGTVGQWIQQAMQAMQAAGIDTSKINPQDLNTIIMHESGGNPRAINNWDSNAVAGHPSQGLMQTIPSTFAAYALPGHGDILNPVDNIIAGARYAMSRYGSISNVPGVAAVNSGGSYVGY